MSDAAGAISLRALTKSYGDGPLAVKGLDLDVADGEFVTLLGPSGSGKTSTLMMVAGFEQPSSGDILVHGRSVVGVDPKQRNLGIVFQSYALFPHMSVEDNVAFPLRMRGVSRKERARKAQEMIERVGLHGLAHRKPRQLSGGQQQRVALARALVFEPDALLLDEPFGALDKKLREQLQKEVKAIQESLGIAVVFVTHDQSEAMSMSDRIALMSVGKIEQAASPQVIYNAPASVFAATFLGETNLFKCTPGVRDGKYVDIALEGGMKSRAIINAAGDWHGRQAFLSIRPERFNVLEDGARRSFELPGTVTAHTFLGASHRFVVKALDQDVIVVVADGTQGCRVRPGDAIRLGWDADDAVTVIDA